ncbi:MAG TPA: electron transfer flavoprotein subunit alpha [Candidatus Sulfopaludibacter sp.]|nr:electron transfer flavoprotein subunit alpha [Candidatus Sulfopaludibacter sp.]
MESILLLAHTESGGTLAKAALEALAAGLGLGGELTIGLVGGETQAAACQVAGAGAARILSVAGEAFSQPRYATDAAAAEALCRASGAAIVIASGTSRWARALPGLAHRLGGRVDTHATGFALRDGSPAVTRWFYRQRMEAVLTRAQRPWVILLDPGCFEAWSGPAGNAAVEPVAVEIPQTRTTVAGVQSPKADEQTIRPDAKLLFVAGAGWTKKQADGAVHAAEAEQLILAFLRSAKASLGGSKSLVDLSGEGEAVLRCMTHLNQIGQTGATPRHPKGLSTCCHGEEPHVVGWRFVGQRRAINLDANCGWARGKADVLYVADAFEVMREVNRLLAG